MKTDKKSASKNKTKKNDVINYSDEDEQVKNVDVSEDEIVSEDGYINASKKPARDGKLSAEGHGSSQFSKPWQICYGCGQQSLTMPECDRCGVFLAPKNANSSYGVVGEDGKSTWAHKTYGAPRGASINYSPSRRPSIREIRSNVIENKRKSMGRITNLEGRKKQQKRLKIISKNSPSFIWYGSLITVIIIGFISILYYKSCFRGLLYTKPSATFVEKFDILKKEFPSQPNILWKALKSGINDTLHFEHPSSYILLHESRYGDVVEKLTEKISEVAVHALSRSNKSPIKLNKSILESRGYPEYGTVIAEFKGDLERIGVMVIENLDEIPEKYALAFHSFCDEIEPLVKNSVFFFTMKVDKLNETPSGDSDIVENILRKQWKGLKDDIFMPLFTRISPMLLRVYPENNQSMK